VHLCTSQETLAGQNIHMEHHKIKKHITTIITIYPLFNLFNQSDLSKQSSIKYQISSFQSITKRTCTQQYRQYPKERRNQSNDIVIQPSKIEKEYRAYTTTSIYLYTYPYYTTILLYII
jgi:hypothetical protein